MERQADLIGGRRMARRAIRRELGTGWMWFDVGYQLVLAWLAALLVYQGGRLLGIG